MARLGQFLEGLIQTFVHPWDTQEAKSRGYHVMKIKELHA